MACGLEKELLKSNYEHQSKVQYTKTTGIECAIEKYRLGNTIVKFKGILFQWKQGLVKFVTFNNNKITLDLT